MFPRSRICLTINLHWFLSQAQELHLKPGETYLRAGDPANSMFVILEGQLEIRGEIGGETVAFTIDAGNVTGALPFSRMKNFTVGAGRSWTVAPPEISGSPVSRACAEDAGTGQAPGGSDVRPDPRNHANRTTAGPVGRPRQAFGGSGA